MTLIDHHGTQPSRARVSWRLSYQGKHEYDCSFLGSEFRVSVRVARERYPVFCNMSEVEFERWENGQSGYVTHSDPSKLTAEFVATFNRLRFEEWQQQVLIMLRQPEKYAVYTPKHFPVYVGASYDKSEGWVRMHAFEEIRSQAGIPEHIAIDPTVFH
jgi:hypothetical protein